MPPPGSLWARRTRFQSMANRMVNQFSAAMGDGALLRPVAFQLLELLRRELEQDGVGFDFNASLTLPRPSPPSEETPLRHWIGATPRERAANVFGADGIAGLSDAEVVNLLRESARMRSSGRLSLEQRHELIDIADTLEHETRQHFPGRTLRDRAARALAPVSLEFFPSPREVVARLRAAADEADEHNGFSVGHELREIARGLEAESAAHVVENLERDLVHDQAVDRLLNDMFHRRDPDEVDDLTDEEAEAEFEKLLATYLPTAEGREQIVRITLVSARSILDGEEGEAFGTIVLMERVRAVLDGTEKIDPSFESILQTLKDTIKPNPSLWERLQEG